MTLRLFTGANIAKTLQDNDLIVIEGATVSIHNRTTGSLEPIFTDKAGLTPKSNPFITDNTGQFSFYIDSGEYKFTVTKLPDTGFIFFELFSLVPEGTLDDFILLSLPIGSSFKTIGRSSIGDGGGAEYKVEANQVVDGFTDVLSTSNSNAYINISKKLTSSMAGVTSAGIDETAKMQTIIDKLSPEKELYIDSTKFSLSGFLLLNNGFKKVTHASGSIVTFLGAGEISTTSKALYSVNLDINGTRTNETILTTTSAQADRGDDTFALTSVAGLAVGNGMRVDKHICIITEISGNDVTTDRTLPIRLMASGSEVSRLDMPNTGSVFEGPSLIQFAADRSTKNYGFGIIAALCIGIKVSGIRSLYNASRLQELFYCADSSASNGYQKSPTDNAGGGQSYAARISNGNDNIIERIKSYNGRHCVDITFSHRNKVMDCDDFNGEFASYLTHFNGCRDNDFIRCHLYDCKFGVFLGGSSAGDSQPEDLIDGDQGNVIRDSKFVNSRGLYRMTQLNKAVNCTFINNVVANFRDVIVPRSNGESVFTMVDCTVDIVNKFCNVDDDYLVNMTGGSYKNTLQDGMWRGLTTGSNPTVPTTDANITFNFNNTRFDFPQGQGRHNQNALVTFTGCEIFYDEQPFGEDCGDIRYRHCQITDNTGGTKFLLSMTDLNECELFNCILIDVALPFRNFVPDGFFEGIVAFGDNTWIGAAEINTLNNLKWSTRGYALVTLAQSNTGTPSNDTIVYIDSDVTTDPFKRKFVTGAWVDWTV